MTVRAAFLSLLLFAGALPLAAAPFTPPAWRETAIRADGTEVKGKLVGWNRDTNRNFIDDLIDERMAAGQTEFDLILAFNRCVTCCETGEDEVVTLLKKVGTLDYLGKYVTFGVVLGVSASDVALLADREEVAMVESLEPDSAGLDISVQAIRVRSGINSPQTVQDVLPGITGAGGNIAILDTGVDNAGGPGITHTMFPAGTFVNGANCLNEPCTIGDPDDDRGHGTHVAGIALGRSRICFGTTTCRGVAPGAGLVDIKVLNSQGSSVNSSTLRGVEFAIAQRAAWNIRVLNLSFGNCVPSNGVNTRAQLVNTAVSHGLVVVVAAGNAGNCGLPDNSTLIADWASASLGITVAAIDDRNTVPLGDDLLTGFSLRGPRQSDNDGDPRDEQKPEISAPGEAILSARFNTANGFVNDRGTSMAAPHVTGAAALILQATPGLNPGSVKEVLLQTAAASRKPGPHPGWHAGWGFGFLDMYAALRRNLLTDVGRPTEPPYAPCSGDWCSPHISTASAPRINQANTISARVRNHAATQANNVRVCFGAYVFSNNANRFHEITCRQVNIPGNTTQTVSVPWTPSASLIPDNFPQGQDIHACLKVSIDYAFDTVSTNNTEQRNTSIARASIARVPFRVENNTTEPTTIRLQVTNSNSKWSVRVFENGILITDPVFFLRPEDCPRDLIIEFEPAPDVPVGGTAQVIVRALNDRGEDQGGIVIDGVHVDHSRPGVLTGQVRTTEGEPLPGVTVRMRDATGFTAATVTDSIGTFRANLPAGEYIVTFEFVGTVMQTRSTVIDPGQTTTLNVVLSTGTSGSEETAKAAPKVETGSVSKKRL